MIVVDTSAIVAILLEELEGTRFSLILSGAADVQISAVTDYETRLIALHRRGPLLVEKYEELVSSGGFSIATFDQVQSGLAFAAYRQYGKGNHSARLNFADCAAYALAKSLDAPLLFKGNDFAQTDVRVAL
ncbi:type II toxin-antitoxin system VapC family toxin [soil metagenome]